MDVLIMGTLYLLHLPIIFLIILFLSKRDKDEYFKETSNNFIGGIIFIVIIAGILSLIF
jgi:hypothetical protein